MIYGDYEHVNSKCVGEKELKKNIIGVSVGRCRQSDSEVFIYE